MARRSRIVLAAVAAGIALAMVPFALPQLTLTYYLPEPTGGTNSNTVLYGPGVAAVVVAGLVVLAEVGWLVWNMVRTPPRPMWIPAVVALVGSIVVVIAVAGGARPTF